MQKSVRFPPEVQERAVQMVVEARGQHDSQWAAIDSIAAKIGCTAEAQRSKEAERENREWRKANEILKPAGAFSTAHGRVRAPTRRAVRGRLLGSPRRWFRRYAYAFTWGTRRLPCRGLMQPVRA